MGDVRSVRAKQVGGVAEYNVKVKKCRTFYVYMLPAAVNNRSGYCIGKCKSKNGLCENTKSSDIFFDIVLYNWYKRVSDHSIKDLNEYLQGFGTTNI